MTDGAFFREELRPERYETKTGQACTNPTQSVLGFIHMNIPLILASGSEIRSTLLRNAGIDHLVEKARVDEETIKASLVSDGATTRDVADALAEMKALKVANRNPEAMVLGCDQVLDFKGDVLSKPTSKGQALAQLKAMRGKEHKLLSAAVIYDKGEPVWRHVGVARLTMDMSSDAYLGAYVERNWESIRHSVGGYKLEEEGLRLFTTIEGDYFTILGLPMIELIGYLKVRGVLHR